MNSKSLTLKICLAAIVSISLSAMAEESGKANCQAKLGAALDKTKPQKAVEAAAVVFPKDGGSEEPSAEPSKTIKDHN